MPTRLVAYKNAEKILLQDEIAILPLFHTQNMVITNKKVSRFQMNGLNHVHFEDIEMMKK